MNIKAINKEVSKAHNIYDRMRATLPVADIDYVREAVLEIIGCPYSTYHNTISGRTQNPNIKIIKTLSIIMDVSIDQVLNPDYEFEPLRIQRDEKLAASLGLSRDEAA